jgi:hypothetical protein
VPLIFVLPCEGRMDVGLEDRLMAAVEFFNGDPVVHTWTYRLDKAA